MSTGWNTLGPTTRWCTSVWTLDPDSDIKNSGQSFSSYPVKCTIRIMTFLKTPDLGTIWIYMTGYNKNGFSYNPNIWFIFGSHMGSPNWIGFQLSNLNQLSELSGNPILGSNSSTTYLTLTGIHSWKLRQCGLSLATSLDKPRYQEVQL